MIGRRAIVGLSLLCALLFCAIATQSAFAQIGAPADNTTAVTCVLGGGEEDFEDIHCDKKVGAGKGDYGHVYIPTDITTELEITNGGIPLVFKGTFAGVTTEISCSKATESTIEIEKELIHEALIHNIHSIFFASHTATGQATLRLSSCTVAKPSKCVVKEPIVSENLAILAREGLGESNEEMGLEFNGGGAGTLFQLTFENKGAEKCSLANGGKPFQIKGSAIATSNVAQGNEHTGATVIFQPDLPESDPNKNPTEEMQTLELGFKQVDFTATLTMRMAGNGSPIAFTTVT